MNNTEILEETAKASESSSMAMDLIRHIAGLYSGKAIKGDFTQIYITGNEIWMAQQVLASQIEDAKREMEAREKQEPLSIQFVNAMPVETQRELGKLLGGSTRSHPYTPPFGCGTRVDIIEAISCTIGRVRVESQISRPPEKGELG